jgi:hypothetical protein
MEFAKKIIKTDTLRLFCKTPDMTDKLSISFSDSFPLVWQRCRGRQFLYFTVLMSYHLCFVYSILFYHLIETMFCLFWIVTSFHWYWEDSTRDAGPEVNILLSCSFYFFLLIQCTSEVLSEVCNHLFLLKCFWKILAEEVCWFK